MKKNIKKLISLALVIVSLVSATVFTFCNPVADGPAVRVNGTLVDFPDGQPYFDENSRTMIPVRFVTEELGADVSWDGKKQAAIIEKDGIRIEIPIGSATFTVTEKGATRNVTMDTTAVAKDGRTYVPIRFVAESLGAYVDYSSAYKTVGIYLDKLTAEEIATLRSYAYTKPAEAVTYETAKGKFSAERLEACYGTMRNTFGEFANAHEYLYSEMVHAGKYNFEALGISLNNSDSEAFHDAVVREAIKEINYSSERVTIEFRTDSSCIYHPDAMDGLWATVRGIAVVKLNVKATELVGKEVSMLSKLGFTQLVQGKEMQSPVDIHMNTMFGYPVNINSYVALSNTAN